MMGSDNWRVQLGEFVFDEQVGGELSRSNLEFTVIYCWVDLWRHLMSSIMRKCQLVFAEFIYRVWRVDTDNWRVQLGEFGFDEQVGGELSRGNLEFTVIYCWVDLIPQSFYELIIAGFNFAS